MARQTIDTAANNIASALTAAGADVHTNGSGLSGSMYVHAATDTLSATVRISDHELPPSYQGDRGEDFRSEVVIGAALGGNWLDAAVSTINALDLAAPAYIRRLLTIRENERRALSEQRERDIAEHQAHRQEFEDEAAALAARLSDEDRAAALAIDAGGESGQVRRRRLGRIAARYGATAGLLRQAVNS